MAKKEGIPRKTYGGTNAPGNVYIKIKKMYKIYDDLDAS